MRHTFVAILTCMLSMDLGAQSELTLSEKIRAQLVFEKISRVVEVTSFQRSPDFQFQLLLVEGEYEQQESGGGFLLTLKQGNSARILFNDAFFLNVDQALARKNVKLLPAEFDSLMQDFCKFLGSPVLGASAPGLNFYRSTDDDIKNTREAKWLAKSCR